MTAERCEHMIRDGICDTCAEQRLAALQAECDAREQAAATRLARHLREHCPYARQDLPCQCHGRIPGSLAAYHAESYRGWPLPLPSEEGRMPRSAEVMLDGPKWSDGSCITESLDVYTSRERLRRRKRWTR